MWWKRLKSSNSGKRAEADVRFVTKIGDDFLGKQTLSFYKKEELNVDNIIIEHNAQTGVALIMLNEKTKQNQIIVVGGACETFTKDDLNFLQAARYASVVAGIAVTREGTSPAMPYKQEIDDFYGGK